MPLIFGLFCVSILVLAASMPLQGADSDYGWAFITLFLGTPCLLAISVVTYIQIKQSIRSGSLSPKRAICYCAVLTVVTLLTYLGVSHHLHPRGISYTFDYGQSSSWHEVQFKHLEKGRQIKGPWVGSYPLQVRFPDINHDGYPDIRVSGDRDEIVEYTYLPINDGKCFWHLEKQKGFATSYPPAGLIYP